MLTILLDDCDFDNCTQQQQEDWIKSYRELRDYPIRHLRSYQIQMFILLAERELDIPEEPQSASELASLRALQVYYLELCEEQVKRLLKRHRIWDMQGI